MMKPLATKAKDINLDNCTSGITFHFPLKSNLEEAIYTTKKRFNFYYNLPHLVYILYLLKIFMFIPNFLGSWIYHFFCQQLDMTMTNVSGFKEPIYLCDKQIHSVYGFLGNYCKCNLTLAINSYNQVVSFQIATDTNIQMDPADLIKLIEENLDKEIAKSKSQ